MENNFNKSIIRPNKQKYLKDKGFIVLIAFLSAFIPLSTDIYLPALPRMVVTFHTSAELINFTIMFFFIFYAAATMFWGPLSDKYGRKPILLTGLVIYMVASILCVFSANVTQLILYRVMQAIGCGAATAVSTAIVKDVYTGRRRLTTLAIVQSAGMLSPIISPVIGALILKLLSWRGVFIVLSILGALALTGSIAMEETIEKRYSGSILKSIGRIGVVLKNKGFRSLLMTFSMMSIPSMSFITASSYIYVSGFGLSEQVYSYFFAANALFFLLGPLVFIKISKKINSGSIITTCFIIESMSGVLIFILGRLNPWLFALSVVPASLTGSIIGPPSTNLMLEQLKGDTGAASSLMSCFYTFFGSIGMLLISSDILNRVLMLGLMYFLIALISLVSWLNIYKKPYINQVSFTTDNKITSSNM